MELTPPFWFKQRQCKAEPAGGEDTYRLSGPNLGEAFIRLLPADGGWRAALRLTADGADAAVTDEALPSRRAAWDAAFELYRTAVIV